MPGKTSKELGSKMHYIVWGHRKSFMQFNVHHIEMGVGGDLNDFNRGMDVGAK